jgi:hypothetical protein
LTAVILLNGKKAKDSPNEAHSFGGAKGAAPKNNENREEHSCLE